MFTNVWIFVKTRGLFVETKFESNNLMPNSLLSSKEAF